MNKPNWIRVTRQRLCPICEKPDWCMVAADGSAVICQRIESAKPVGTKGAGWLHRLQSNDWHPPHRFERPKPSAQKVQRDWSKLAQTYFDALSDEGRQYLGEQLGISPATLGALRVGWSSTLPGSTWPMLDASGVCRGIRTRDIDNAKKAISGTDGNGLFFAPSQLSTDYLIVCEGPTDAATLIDSGFGSTVGRPSCSAGNSYIVELLKRFQPSAVLLVPDRDDAGLAGFSVLANDIIQAKAISLSKLDSMTPPKDVNDIRDWARKSREHLAGRIATKLEQIKQRTGGSFNE